jgi:hypothetical protein
LLRKKVEVVGNISSAFDVREQKRLWLNTMLVQCAPIECFQSWKLGKPNWCATTMRLTTMSASRRLPATRRTTLRCA